MRELTKCIRIPVAGVDIDEVAGLIASERDCVVMIDEDGEENSLSFGYSGETGEEVVAFLLASFPGSVVGSPTIEPMEERDWLEKWKENFTPLPVGERLMILPTWRKEEQVGERIPLVLDPGLAFGTGHHATTAGCLAALEKESPRSALDVGTGSGILAIGTALLGAERVVAFDNDPKTLPVAEENVRLNGVSDRVELSIGDITAISGVFDLIVANIYLRPLIALSPHFHRLLKSGGRLIVSGITEKQIPEAEKGIAAARFKPVGRHIDRDWGTLTLEPVKM